MEFLAGCAIAYVLYYFYKQDRNRKDAEKSIINQALTAELMEMNPDYKEMLSGLLGGEPLIAYEAQQFIDQRSETLLNDVQREVDFASIGSPKAKENKYLFLREHIFNILYPYFGNYRFEPIRHYLTIEEMREEIKFEQEESRKETAEFNRQYREENELPPWD